MKWKITDPTGKHKYYEPSEVTVMMVGCKLYNNVTGAKRIYEGSHKYVVAWVEAKDVKVLPKQDVKIISDKISYNPRVTPHWTRNGEVVDGFEYETLTSINRGLYLQ
jgi:hypothetical protein